MLQHRGSVVALILLGAAALSAFQRPTQAPVKWEYTHTVSTGGTTGPLMVESNDYGSRGWEMIECLTFPGDTRDPGVRFLCLYKRPAR